ncbi:MAG: hypothetical protein QXN02_02950, partial [Ignisphaera sp.]
TMIYLQIDISLTLILIIAILGMIIYMIYAGFSYMKKRQHIYQEEIPYKFTTVIKCLNKDYSTEREFREGDFIGKIEGLCPKCGNNMVIDYIYALYTQKKQQS